MYRPRIEPLRAFLERRRRVVAPFVFALIGVVLVLHARSTPIADMGPDGHTYEEWGYRAAVSTSILDCDNFWHAYWSPTWVTSIALLYRATGREPIAIRYLLIAFVLATCALIYMVAREVAGDAAAIAAVCLYALSSLIFRFTTYLQYEVPLALLLFASGFLVFFRLRARAGERWRLPATPTALDHVQLFVSGIALGLATLTTARGFAMLFLLVACFYLKGRVRYVVRALPALALGVVVVLGPWTARNHRCYGEWIFATTNGGLNFFVGHNEYATLGYRSPPPEIMPQAPRYESDVYMKASLDYIKAHPGTTAWRVLARLFKFWNPHYADQVLIYVLFFVGLVRVVRKKTPYDAGTVWLLSMPFLFMLIHAAFYVQVRYVIPALPCIAVAAAAGLFGWRAKAAGPR